MPPGRRPPHARAAREGPAHGAASDITSASPDWRLERPFWARGYGVVAGVDEAGRGALAGPVVAAVVVLPYGTYPFDDSKKLSAERRELLAAEVKRCALAWAVGAASAEEIDTHNVLQATHLAAQRALSALRCVGSLPRLEALVTDFLRLSFPGPVASPPKADSSSLQVAAASILAKTTRDALMRTLSGRYPVYGFSGHKGYGAPAHLRALADHGPCPEHRRSFAPVRRCL